MLTTDNIYVLQICHIFHVYEFPKSEFLLMLLAVNFGTAIRELSLSAGVLKFNCKQTSLFLISVEVMKKMLVPWLDIKLNNDL